MQRAMPIDNNHDRNALAMMNEIRFTLTRTAIDGTIAAILTAKNPA